MARLACYALIFRKIMRLLFLLLFLVLIDFYAFQAIRVVFNGATPSTKQSVRVLFFSLNALMLAFTLAYAAGWIENWGKVTLTLLRSLVFIAYFSKFLVLPFLLIEDLYRGIRWVIDLVQPRDSFDPSRSRFISQLGLMIGAIPLVSLTYGIFRNAYRFKLRSSQVKIPGLPPELLGLRIVQISDIHSGSFLYPEDVAKAVDLVNQQKPDLVFFTGDLVNNTADEVIPLLPILKKIQARYGVFSVLGNHDYGDYVRWDSPEQKTENLRQLKDYHRQLGWTLLTNENRVITIEGRQVAIIGVENYSTHLRFPKYGNLKAAYQGSEKADLKLLLSHDPSHWTYEVTSRFPDIAITFSGHTHGFQFGVEIPGFIRWSPVQYVYKEWAGLYQKGSQSLYVNRGLGHLGYPGRVGILPEVTCLDCTT